MQLNKVYFKKNISMSSFEQGFATPEQQIFLLVSYKFLLIILNVAIFNSNHLNYLIIAESDILGLSNLGFFNRTTLVIM